jgi:hypothetical protein
MNRKDALKRLNGLAPQVEQHLDKIRDNLSSQDVPHWTREVEGWIRQIETMLPDIGQRTADDWVRRIEGWKKRLGG